MKSTKMYNVIWFTGQAGAGKTVLANELKNHLQNITKQKIVIIDGDDIRDLYKNTDYSIEGRKANVDFVQKLCTFLIKNEIVPVVSMVSPFAEQRKKFIEENNGIEIYVYCNEIRGRENYHVDYYEKPIESKISVNLDTTNKNVKQSFNELWKIIS
jgi:adenylylsulfate kinase-like enzyme